MRATEHTKQRKTNVKRGVSVKCMRKGKVRKSQKFITHDVLLHRSSVKCLVWKAPMGTKIRVT